MLKHIIPNIKNDSLELTGAKLTILTAFVVAGSFSIIHFIIYDSVSFYTNSTLFLTLTASMVVFRNKDIYFKSKIALTTMLIGINILIYTSAGRDSVYLWIFIGIFYLMVTFGHKEGLIGLIIFLLVAFLTTYGLVDETISLKSYIRFVAVSVILSFIAYAYEYAKYVNVEKLKSLTNTDTLTNLYNRRSFDEIFIRQQSLAKRNRKLFAFAMIDIDFFKLYNDTYGHLAGDDILIQVANEFKRTMLRADDYVFRLGGEEFAVIFHAETEASAIKQMEQLRMNIEELHLEHKANPVNSYVTISIGMCILQPNEVKSLDAIHKTADDALYKAKLKGRNQVVPEYYRGKVT
ncbi:GGDEF domain-containing protein [Vibrio sp. JC009]|uniref:GGDEF domain-containing protein n=1 Tax=Vibrio sp. JC009 TaxID=2912314 RepID=UPI0023B0CEFF|nr:GGDEF domain-containing protein [Vibrio sp. JC009]WED20911.1 GGDEF domain-containing protein [Vibrio sp. JC009]